LSKPRSTTADQIGGASHTASCLNQWKRSLFASSGTLMRAEPPDRRVAEVGVNLPDGEVVAKG
jgi:hypothetical protein